jgi:hypothetical protein
VVHELPVDVGSGRAEGDAVDDFGDDFGSLGNHHAGAVEEEVAVGENDFTGLNGAQRAPPRERFENGLFAEGAFESETAGSDDEIFGIGVNEFLRGDRGGVLAFGSDQEIGVGELG